MFYKNSNIYRIHESPEDYDDEDDGGDQRSLNNTAHCLSESDLKIMPTLNIIARHKALSPISQRVNKDVCNNI